MKSDLPKVMHCVANKPMLWHVLRAAEEAGSSKNVVVVQDAHEEVKELARSFPNTEIAVQKEQLGTGDAVKSAQAALENFDGNVVILNGDCPLIGQLAEHNDFQNFFSIVEESDIALLGFEIDNPDDFGYGRLIIEDDTIKGIIEQKDATPEEREITYCNAGTYALKADLLFNLLSELKNNNAAREYYLTDIIKIANQKGLKAGGYLVDPSIVGGVNTKLDLAIAEENWQNYVRRLLMINLGVTLIAPDTVFFSADTKIGQNVVIKPFTVIGEDVEIGDNVTIGPFAHIRPGTRIEADAKIGNFVEIKKSTIGKGSKVSHLSYIGDSELGEDVNIGAGTITCNYDGFKKYQTKIKDGVFIGSNTALIAPVEIGRNSVIGAGSTITDDVPEETIAVSRTPQKNLAGKAPEYRKRKESE